MLLDAITDGASHALKLLGAVVFLMISLCVPAAVGVQMFIDRRQQELKRLGYSSKDFIGGIPEVDRLKLGPEWTRLFVLRNRLLIAAGVAVVVMIVGSAVGNLL